MKHLQLRGTVWWYRRVVPADLRPSLGREFIRSLGTDAVHAAQQRAHQLDQRVEALFKAARGKCIAADADLPDHEAETLIERLVNAYLREMLAEDRVARRTSELARDPDLGDAFDIAQEAAAEGRVGDVVEDAIRLLARAGARLPADRLEGLLHELLVARIRGVRMVERDREADLVGNARVIVPPVVSPAQPVVTPTAGPTATAGVALADAVKVYVADRYATGEWKRGDRNAKAREAQLARFVEIVGGHHRPMAAIRRADGVRYLEKLTELNIGVKTQRSNVATVIALWNYGLDADVRWVASNPFIKLRPSQAAIPKTKGAYSDDDIRKLYTTELAAEREGAHPWRYWVPLILLHTGARANEIAQLRVEDVRDVQGIHVLRITDEDGKRIKNAASIREVPIHQYLVECGFLDYVSEVGRVELFSGARDAQGGAGELSRFWTAWRRARGVGRAKGEESGKKLDLHSFRNTVTQRLHDAGHDYALIAQITGWAQQGMGGRVYGAGAGVKRLAEVVADLDYREALAGLDAKPLRTLVSRVEAELVG